MGNSYICSPIQYFKEIRLNGCYQAERIEKDDNQIIINLDKDYNNFGDKINQLKNYFHENEKEIFNNHNKKEKHKKHFNRKKHNNALNKLFENKYELMLKRLLEQKQIKIKGPKRRETIRNEEKIKLIVNEILLQNINSIKNKKMNNDNALNNNEGDLLIKDINNSKFRNSATIDKKSIITNKIYKLKDNYYLQYRNTINEIINEGSNISNLCKKQTEQTYSPQNKKEH